MTESNVKSTPLAWLGVELRLALTTFGGRDAARARNARVRAVDVALVVLAAVLPWTTAGALGALIASFALLLLTVPLSMWPQTLARPACALALALFVLAVIGTAWAHGVPTHDKVRAIGQVYKLIMIGLLFAHFQDSRRAAWVFVAFVASNAVLLAYSYGVYALPEFALVHKPDQPGVAVKNYIDQSQGFALSGVALAALAFDAARRNRRPLALSLGALALAFILNLAFVNVARTALVYLPVMLLVWLGRQLDGRRFAAAVAGLCVLALAAWATSPNLQAKVARVFTETATFGAPVGPDGPTSAAMRLEYWEKSLAFARAAPLLGHGTGSTRMLFVRDAEGKADLEALVTYNPHNQTLAVALQWGLVGCVLLWAMWAAHLALFRGPGFVALFGLLAVVQNIIGSLFNSHLFDFYEGWIYVLAVGIAGGVVMREATDRPLASRPRIV
jgi:hypothetical protein